MSKELAENLRIRIRELESQRDELQAEISELGVELRRVLHPVLLPIQGLEKRDE
jgi:hypothetical protein